MEASEFLQRYRNGDYELSDEMRQSLGDGRFRATLYSLIPLSRATEYRDLLRILFEAETAYRNSNDNDGTYFESIYICAFLLFAIGDLDDVLPMWKAKTSNFDLGCGFDIQFLVGAGLNQTIEFLKHHKDPDALKALEYIESCRATGDFSFQEKWIESKVNYFGIEYSPASHSPPK